jgi:hypothetical protein
MPSEMSPYDQRTEKKRVVLMNFNDILKFVVWKLFNCKKNSSTSKHVILTGKNRDAGCFLTLILAGPWRPNLTY